MKTISEFPHRVRALENAWIPMSDGCRLAARIWMPEDAEQRPVPAILEYIPYRKRDNTRERDAINQPYLAGHGYAVVRVDIRGSGDSSGVLSDEYLEQEQLDGLEILRWIAGQPWCDGNIGMIGISWGGFNGLQIAALNPPELKAVISLCSTDDRYADDVHYMGGCLLGDNLSWASVMFAYNSCPPDPAIVGDDWRELWLQRLEGSGLWVDKWMRHQRRDVYWEHGSVCEDYTAIQCPVLVASGWADGYSNSIFRLLASLQVPRKGLIGPWSHMYPHMGIPGPAIGFLQEALRWWDRWLKGTENGIDDEPMLRVWMQDSVPPTTSYDFRPGRWVAEPTWPSPHVSANEYQLAAGRVLLDGHSAPEQGDVTCTIESPLSVGLFAGKWCSYSAAPDLPHDQREEDGGALVFDSEPLPERLEILGAPIVELELISNKPVAMLAVRLSDVAPNDQATRITYGLLNLTHRNGHADPEPLEPGKRYRVSVDLNDIAQVFPKGHRLRLSVSTSYWPLAWPPPESARLTLFPVSSKLVLPVRPERESDADLRPFDEPEGAPRPERELIETTRHNWMVTRDLAKDESTLHVIKDEGKCLLPDIALTIEDRTEEWYTYRGTDFNSVRGETLSVRGFQRGEWHVRTITRTVITSTPTHFHIHASLDGYEGDQRVYSRNWDRTIPRDNV